jgi:hypothetical protein
MLVSKEMPDNIANQLFKNRIIYLMLLPSSVLLILFSLYTINPSAIQIIYPIPNLLLGIIAIITGIVCGYHGIYLIREEHKMLLDYL